MRRVESAPRKRYGRLGGVKASSPVVRNYSLTVITVIAVMATLHFARPVALPIALAIFGFLLLNPLVLRLRRMGLPRVAAVILIQVAIFGALAGLAYSTADPMVERLKGLPQDLREVRSDLLELRRPFAEAQESAKILGDLSGLGEDDSYKVEVVQPTWLDNLLASGQMMVVTIAIAGFLTLLLLLTARDSRQAVRAAPLSPGTRRRVTVCVGRAQRDVSRYLGWVVLINAALGAIVAFVLAMLGMNNPLMWGLIAGVANFVPYIGPLAVLVLLWIAGVVQFGGIVAGSWPALAFLVLTSVEGQLVTPAVLGRHLALPPPLIFVAILVFGWSWGLVGAFLAVPALVTGKAIIKYWPMQTPAPQRSHAAAAPVAEFSYVPDRESTPQAPAA